MNSTWRLVRARTMRRVRSGARKWRGSLQVRVITTTMAIGLVALAVIGVYVSERMRDGLFTARVDQVLEESARSTKAAQATFDASTATSGTDVLNLLHDVALAQRAGGSGAREVFLLRAPGQKGGGVAVTGAASAPVLVPLVSPELKAVTATGGQHWQSVAWPVTTGDEPAVMVGQNVNVRGVGTYQLFFLYSLQSEQDRLEFLQRTLLLAAVALVALLGSMTWLVTRQAVRPVRRAAEVAERLADGHLSERMPERGEDEMATLARSFNEMAASLQDQIHRMEELSTLQRRFVSDVSHELRTPLTTVRMAGEVIYMSRGTFDPAVKRSAELLQTQLDRFEELLADLLEISRFDAGAAVLEAGGRDVRDVVVAAVDHAAPLAERRSTWLRVTVPEKACLADIDPRRVERILRNLLVNAIEHAEGTAVEVTVGADSHAVAVTVRDRGVGMTPDEAQHVFDRFWRADPARARTTGGTGLGLAISLEDAHLHGGWLEAWGRPGRGASFRLTLPRRAGIRLTDSPLPLVPDETPTVDAVRVPLVRPNTDPAALPDLADAREPDPSDEPQEVR
ncbi:MtrAB system histidine kinase MtrB [Cellulomonas sp. McL0617]|uniref:MtrAB system histidine kinase MtrB n=1 Tax=Cellulomonas sp. McL0617 TaxID=3415675 RepID=UPI003CF13D1B